MAKNILLASVVLVFLYVAQPMLMPVCAGALLAILFFPAMERLNRQSLKPTIASALLSFGVTVLLLLPAAFLGFLGIRTVIRQYNEFNPSFAAAWIQSDRVQKILDWFSQMLSMPAYEILQNIEAGVQSFLLGLVNWLTLVITQIPGFLVMFSVTVLSMYFFFIEGNRLVEFFKKHSVLDTKNTRLLIDAAAKMVRSVMAATFISATMQAVVFGIAMVVFGIGHTATLGFLAFVFSFIPLVGSLPVFAGVGVYELLTGHSEIGVVFLVLGALVSVADNVLRAVVMRDAGNLHPLLAFIGAFGGIQVLGPMGVFLGPILAGLCMTAIQILIEGRKSPAA